MPRRRRPLLVGLVSSVLALGGLLAVTPGQAEASPTSATICQTCVVFTPASTVFDEASETLTAVVEVDVPANNWAFDRGILRIQDIKNNTHDDWLKLDSQTRIGQIHKLTFTGKVPNQLLGGTLNRNLLKVYPQIYYRNNGVLKLASLPTPTYYYVHRVNGDTKATLAGPGSITTGSALTLTGNVSCFKLAGYQTVEQGAYVAVQYSPTNADPWTDLGSAQASTTTGNWTFTVPSVGATLYWRALSYPNSPSAESCVQPAFSPSINVVAGTEPPPPPPPTLPGAPGLVVSAVTQSTIALTWTAPTSSPGQSAITGYRFGWVSANGQPQPSFSTVVPVPPANPYVFTGLVAGVGYSVFAEAVTADGPGARTTLSTTTQAAPPPPPAVRAPGAPRSVGGQAKNHKAIITWQAPDQVAGAVVTKYCVQQVGGTSKCVGAGRLKVKFKGLTNGTKYSFTVQAYAGDIPGPLSAVVKVKPTR